MVSSAIRQFVLLIPCLILLLKTVGIRYAWYAFWIAEIITCVYSYCSSRKWGWDFTLDSLVRLGSHTIDTKLSFYPTIHFPHQWHPLQLYLLLQVLHRGCIGTSVSPDGYDKPERFACTLWYAFGIR